MCTQQEAARRCKVDFQSRADDKTPCWMITDNFSEPFLITEAEGGVESGKTDSKKDMSKKTKQEIGNVLFKSWILCG